MSSLYPFTVLQEKDVDKTKARHLDLIVTMSSVISERLHDTLPYLNENGFLRQTAGYGRILTGLLLHVPADSIDEVQGQVIRAGDELMMHGSKTIPPAFEVIARAGHHLVVPGAMSWAEIEPGFRGFRSAHGVLKSYQTIEMIEIIVQRAERRMEWIRDGRPDDRNPRILKFEAGPEKSFIEKYMDSMSKGWKEETKLKRAQNLLNYMRRGQRILNNRMKHWEQSKGRR